MKLAEKIHTIPKKPICEDTSISDEIYRVFKIKFGKIFGDEIDRKMRWVDWELDASNLLQAAFAFAKHINTWREENEEIMATWKEIWFDVGKGFVSDSLKWSNISKIVGNAVWKYALKNTMTLATALDQLESQYKAELLVKQKSSMTYTFWSFICNLSIDEE